MQKMLVINRTDVPITFGTFTVEPGSSKIMYDIDDKSTYESAMFICRNHFDAVKHATLEKRISFFYDGIPFTSESHFNMMWDHLKSIFATHSVGYSSEHKFYFDIGMEAFCVVNIITGKTYRIKMEKDGDGTPWLNGDGGGI